MVMKIASTSEGKERKRKEWKYARRGGPHGEMCLRERGKEEGVVMKKKERCQENKIKIGKSFAGRGNRQSSRVSHERNVIWRTAQHVQSRTSKINHYRALSLNHACFTFFVRGFSRSISSVSSSSSLSSSSSSE